jgi:hypothetical protein
MILLHSEGRHKMPEPRRYALVWRKTGDRKWTRAYPTALPKQSAVRVFQGALLSGAFRPDIQVELRVTKVSFTQEYTPIPAPGMVEI